MHRSYEFAVGDALRDGENHLRVRFDSAYRVRRGAARGARRPARRLPRGRTPSSARWPATSAGTGDRRLVTAGIWREIGLRRWRVARLAEVAPLVTVDGAEGRVDLRIRWRGRRLRRPSRSLVTAEVTGHGAAVRGHVVLAPAGSDAAVTLAVPRPARWWPRGYGDQPRYQLTVTLAGAGRRRRSTPGSGGSGSVRSGWTPRRTSTARRTPWSSTTCRSSCGGSTGSPTTRSSAGSTRDATPRGSARPSAANVNYLRVWGGGIVRVRRLLRPVRRARSAGGAGLPVLLRGLPGGAADRRRGGGRGA